MVESSGSGAGYGEIAKHGQGEHEATFSILIRLHIYPFCAIKIFTG